MFNSFPILSTITFLPLLGAFLLYVLAVLKPRNDNLQRYTALFVSLVVFVLSLLMLAMFDPSNPTPQLLERSKWINGYEIFYFLGVDGISIYFVLLTTLLTPICVISSWNSISQRVPAFLISFLALESFVLGSFLALDFLLFYVFFEAVLIPMYLIIGIWGGQNRIYAAYKFFLYTLAGSVLLLLAVIYIYYQTGTTDVLLLSSVLPGFSLSIQKWLWLAFFASFAVKIPMFPVHTWLPDAHVQAPTAGSVILAGILLKLGGYGFLRFSLPMLPAASIYFTDFMMWLSAIAVIYTSLVALMQEDMKKLIAYSSIAHMAYVTAGIFALNQQGIEGAIFQMISHGLVSAALFLCVGVLYDRMHTKEIAAYGGVTNIMPKFAFQFLVFTMASVGLPITAGFVGEFLVLLGVFQYSKLFSAFLATGMVLGAAYMLWLFARVMFGKVKSAKLEKMPDLDSYEKLSLWPLLLAVFWFGIYPTFILSDVSTSVQKLVEQVHNPDYARAATMELPESFEIIIDMD